MPKIYAKMNAKMRETRYDKQRYYPSQPLYIKIFDAKFTKIDNFYIYGDYKVKF